MPDCAVITVTKDRVDLTEKCLHSLFMSDQTSSDYDLFIIDNGSTKDNLKKLKNIISKTNIKNMYVLDSEVPISVAFNLGLSMTQEYPFRVKLDNDMVIPGFSNATYSPPQTIGTNPGSPKVASFVVGAKRSHKIVHKTYHSRFIDHMKNVIHDQNVSIAGLVPISPVSQLNAALKIASSVKWQNMPYLIGGCMMIPKDTFDKLGYFNEKLLRKIDVEYSQRAMKLGLNVGYCVDFGLIHIGDGLPADKDQYQKNNSSSTTFLYDNETKPVEFITTIWNECYTKLKKASKNVIVNVSDVQQLIELV